MNAYCVKCKKDTKNNDPKMFRTKNNRFHYDDYYEYYDDFYDYCDYCAEVFREKSNCMVCQSNRLRFLKQKHSNKKQFFQIIKTCICIVKTVKNIQVIHFPKN